MLLSRFPFLGLGFGTEPDGWRVAQSAAQIAATGEFAASRLGANRLHELGTALLGGGDVWIITFVSAVVTAMASGFLALMVWRIRVAQSALLGLAFGFVPIVFIASTGGRDYAWTLLFITASAWAALEDRAWLAGILFGLAVGCRLSMATMALMPLILVAGHDQPGRQRQALKLVFAMAVVVVVIYAPIVHRYGFAFLRPSEVSPPTFELIVKKALLDVWGLMGLIGLAIAVVSAILSSRTAPIFVNESSITSPQWRRAAWLVGIGMPAALFIAFPAHAGSWVPAVPFVLLLAAERVAAPIVRVLAICLMLSPFVMGVRPVRTPERLEPAWGRRLGRARIDYLRGPMLYDVARRKARLRIARRVMSDLDVLESGATVLVGSWQPMLNVLRRTENHDRVAIRYAPSEADFARTASSTPPLYALPGVLRSIEKRHGIDLADVARPLPSDAW